MSLNYSRAAIAVLAGSAVIVVGDLLLGVQIEFFYGMATFTFPWILDVFLVPFISGIVVALVYWERGGKWLAFIPPILVRMLNCFYLYLSNDQWNEDFFYLLHLHYWGPVVILAAEAANLGGFLGEARNGAYLRNNKNVKGVADGEAQRCRAEAASQQLGDKV